MSNVLLCLGKCAQNPFYVADDNINLYSVEELCFYMQSRVFLLDDNFVSDQLAQWVKEELELEELGIKIFKYAGKTEALTCLVNDLYEDIGYLTLEEADRCREELKRASGISSFERRKIRADGFFREGKYSMAMDEYEEILKYTSYAEGKFRSKLYHNLGVCLCKQFMFRRAADYFQRAYDNYANTESYVSMLMAMKLYMSPEEYLNYISDHSESYEDSLEVERCFNDIETRWTGVRADGSVSDLEKLKQDYRNSASEARRLRV